MTDAITDKPIILVVDDSRLMRVAARKILKNDFEVLEAEDGEIAWQTLQSNPRISLVMSDLSMPNLDGLGLVKQIRQSAEPQLSNIPVIIVTGAEDDDGSKETALSAGASDFITKPFDSVQLLARAQTQARQQRTQQALQDSEVRKQQLEEQNNLDELTGLANKRAFIEHLEEGLSYAVRHRTELAVLVVQVDKYKVLFLRRGKECAESVLGQLAKTLCTDRRREDTVARIGMDTFAILLPCANPVGARRVAEQLRSSIENQVFNNAGETLSITASVAASCPLIHADTKPQELLADASEKLKSAQHAGGNCVVHKHAAAEPESLPADADDTSETLPPQHPQVASIADVQRALEALSMGQQPDGRMTALIRATLPLLGEWNRTQDNRHSALLERLQTALQADEAEQSAADLAAGPAQSLHSW
jgi:two-component system cell cycle response regulator